MSEKLEKYCLISALLLIIISIFKFFYDVRLVSDIQLFLMGVSLSNIVWLRRRI